MKDINVMPDTILWVGYEMWLKIQDYTDSAYYNLRSHYYADKQMAKQQFAVAEAHKRDFDDFYDTLIKPMGLSEKFDEMISERFSAMAA